MTTSKTRIGRIHRTVESGLATPVNAGSTIAVRIHFDERRLGFSVDGSPMAWFGPGLLAYAVVGFQPVSAQPYVEFGDVHGDERLLPVEQCATE